MYKIKILNFEKKYLLDELIKIFLRPEEYSIVRDDENIRFDADALIFNRQNAENKDIIKREIYDRLSAVTGMKPQWGILTGVRPVKLAGKLYERTKDAGETEKSLREDYYLSREKATLITRMYLYQRSVCGRAPENSAAVYIGIPFCPSRCLYCSFASNRASGPEIARYLEALGREIYGAGKRMKETGIFPETVYMGGGTPTTLTAKQSDDLFVKAEEALDLSRVRELTVEAGRPDTITEEKLLVMKRHGACRISINPQSMKDKTLKLIGRNHTAEDVRRAFGEARSVGFKEINADIIAGLPEETPDDFSDTLNQVIDLRPENITVHCLSVKRASRLMEMDRNFHYRQAEAVSTMLERSRKMLNEAGYVPYYLYRQKHMAGACENTGYCRKGTEGIYNIRSMSEHQIIVAFGAGGISKMYYPGEDRVERVPNVTNYEEYISRVDEMIARKELRIFKEVENNVDKRPQGHKGQIAVRGL